jgi:tetratricopeptide (TPR) repeat protein
MCSTSGGATTLQKPVIVETKKRYAVCIGINHYRDSQDIPTLRYAEKDAQAVYDLLLQRGFAQEDCRLLLGSQATQQAIHDALKTVVLDKPRKEDLVLFYFAGHGIPISLEDDEEDDVLSDVFLTCVDFPLQEIRTRRGSWLDFPLRLGHLRTQFFEQTRSKKVLFILDSCHSGDFYGSQYRGNEIAAHDYIDRAFGRMSAGRVVLSSCMPQQKAYEDKKWQHGRFTYHLLDALEGNQRNAVGRDGWITVSSLFDYLAKTMRGVQCPVESGVKHGSFELLYYSTIDETLAVATEPESPEVERVFRLRALFAQHQEGFLHDRLASFVGREKELAEIRVLIARQQQAGGYLIITGQAGQGKSSIIAKLVEAYGPDNVAYHFIPFNPGPDHQVGLLRNLMARLILKYRLSDFYVASESRGALRDYFPKVLDEVVAQRGHEIIFIDGLDQIELEATGIRDLSFLPSSLPSGIVFVLSVRPNDARNLLKVLVNLYDEYPLPNLSRQDFDSILQHRQVTLEREQADQFYAAMQQNALYLDLVAKELLEADCHLSSDIIARLTSNPDNLFSLTMMRLKRYPLEWREVLKPLLGVLLVAQAPLSRQSLRQILNVDADQLNEGLVKLGGLLLEDEQQRYSLFHLKLQEYLREDKAQPHKEYIFATDEVEGWHSTLASWCELRDLSLIWKDVPHNEAEQSRRLYARHNYITHLYEARQWERLFEELDTGQYGRGKLHIDPSMRLYVQDLTYGCRATAWEGWTLEEGIALLPRLWRYTLLKCSLTSRANNYPEEAFELLLLLKRRTEALNLVELLTSPVHKVRVLLCIARHLVEEFDQQVEGGQILMRACTVARTIRGKDERAEALGSLGSVLARLQQRELADTVWKEVETVVYPMEGGEQKDWTLRNLGIARFQAQQWEEAETIVRSIEDSYLKGWTLSELGSALAQVQLWEHANAMWVEAEIIAHTVEHCGQKAWVLGVLGSALAQSGQGEKAKKLWEYMREAIFAMEDGYSRSGTLSNLGSMLAQAEQWEQANAVLLMIEDVGDKVQVLTDLGSAQGRAGRWEKAQEIFAEVEKVIYTIEQEYSKSSALYHLGIALAQNHQWEHANTIIRTITKSDLKVKALSILGSALVKKGQRKQAEVVWEEAETVIYMVEDSELKAEVLNKLANALTKTGQWEQVNTIWQKAKAVALITELRLNIDESLSGLVSSLIQAQQWECAEEVVSEIQHKELKVKSLCELGIALDQAQQWERSHSHWAEAEVVTSSMAGVLRDEFLPRLSKFLLRAHQWEHLETITHTMEDNDDRAWVLISLGSSLAQAQQWEHAHTIWREVEEIAHTIEDSDDRARVLISLGSSLAQAQQWEHANRVWQEVEEIAHTIEDSDDRARVLISLGSSLAQAQQWEHANRVWQEVEEIAHTIEDSDDRAWVLISLGCGLVQTQQWEHAHTIWREVEETADIKRDRDEKLSKLGRDFVQIQQWEHAKALTPMIENDYQRDWVLYDLAKALAQAEQWKDAEAVFSKIEDDLFKVMALCELGVAMTHAHRWEQANAIWGEVEAMGVLMSDRYQEICVRTLAQMEQWERAETILRSMQVDTTTPFGHGEYSKTKNEALCEMADALAKTNEHERLLRLVQRWWSQTKTRNETLTLLTLANKFIALKPDIGMAFYEAFAWVDTFLQRVI